MLRVWLVRHGQSESNAGAPSADPGAPPLTARGHEQADRLAAALPEAPALIVASPYRRAAQTAEPTSARFPHVRLVEWPVQEFAYLGTFHHRLTTSDERRPHVVEYWRRADPQLSVGGAESFAELLVRVHDCVDRLSREPAGPVVVFTHGQFMRAVVWTLLAGGGADADGMRAFHRFSAGFAVPNCAVVELRFPSGAAPQVVAGVPW